MSYFINNLPGPPGPGPRLALAALADPKVAAASHPGLVFHLDCSAQPYQRTLGVCHQVSQLLLLRRTGCSITLYQVNPVLSHCLGLLKVAHLFASAA